MHVEKRSQFYSGVILAIAGTFLFALKSIFIKFAYFEGADADQVLFLRMILSAPVYLAVLLWESRKRTPRNQIGEIGWKGTCTILGLGFLGYYLASYLDIAGLSYISAQLERLTLFTYPTLIALLAWAFLGETFTRRILGSLLLSYLGLWCLIGQELEINASDNVFRGVALVMGAALSYSVYVILAKPKIRRYGSSRFTSIAMLGSTLFVLIHMGVLNKINIHGIPPKVWLHCSLLAFLSTVIPSYMVAEAINRIGASRTAILGTVGPVFTVLLAVVLINEPFGWMHAIGMTIVVYGVSLAARK